MNFLRNNFANILTLGNLFSGSVGAIHLIQGNYQVTAICIIISLVFDFFDGLVARALQSNSELGVQLDSLADMVSFGLIPGLTMFKMLEPFGTEFIGISLPFPIQYFGLLITLFSCLRLAIFNLDDEQKYYFKGLNTPTNTVLIFGLYYAAQLAQTTQQENPLSAAFSTIRSNETLLVLITVLSSWLLVSPIKMIAMKFKSMKWQDNIPKIVLLIGSSIILAVLNLYGIPIVVVYYILVSIVFQKQIN